MIPKSAYQSSSNNILSITITRKSNLVTHLNADTVGVVTLATLSTGYKSALIAIPIASTTFTHILDYEIQKSLLQHVYMYYFSASDDRKNETETV